MVHSLLDDEGGPGSALSSYDWLFLGSLF